MSMHLTPQELGAVQVILEEFQKHRLPRLLDMRKHVDEGGLLNDFDVLFLSRALEDAKGSTDFADKHPEFQLLVAEVAELYHHITQTALENEAAAS